MSELTFDALGPGDYDRAKTVLNRAKHPGFVGRDLYSRCATAGTCTIAVLDGADVGVALVVSQKLQALSVVSSAQGAGVGARLIDRIQPRWASVIGDRVEWFKRRGYREVGSPKVGQKGSTTVQLMERVSEPVASDAPTSQPSNFVVLRQPQQPGEPTEPAMPLTPHAMRDGRRDLDRTVSAIVRVWDRRDLVERMLTQLQPESAITRALMSEGLTKQQAHRYQAAVRMRWRKNGQLEGAQGRAERYRAALEAQARKADNEGDRRSCVAALGLLLKHEGEAAAHLLEMPVDATPATSTRVLVMDRQQISDEIASRLSKENT